MLWENYIYNLYSNDITELEAWEKCYLLALRHYITYEHDISKGSNHYMTLDKYKLRGEKPFSYTIPVQVLGNHIFFISI